MKTLADFKKALAEGATVTVIDGHGTDGKPHHAIGQVRRAAKVTSSHITWADMPDYGRTAFGPASGWTFPAPGLARVEWPMNGGANTISLTYRVEAP